MGSDELYFTRAQVPPDSEIGAQAPMISIRRLGSTMSVDTLMASASSSTPTMNQGREPIATLPLVRCPSEHPGCLNKDSPGRVLNGWPNLCISGPGLGYSHPDGRIHCSKRHSLRLLMQAGQQVWILGSRGGAKATSRSFGHWRPHSSLSKDRRARRLWPPANLRAQR